MSSTQWGPLVRLDSQVGSRVSERCSSVACPEALVRLHRDSNSNFKVPWQILELAAARKSNYGEDASSLACPQGFRAQWCYDLHPCPAESNAVLGLLSSASELKVFRSSGLRSLVATGFCQLISAPECSSPGAVWRIPSGGLALEQPAPWAFEVYAKILAMLDLAGMLMLTLVLIIVGPKCYLKLRKLF